MDSRGLVMFVVALIVGAIVGGSVVFIDYFPQLDLGQEIIVVDSSEYDELLVEYDELFEKCVELNDTSVNLFLRKEQLDAEIYALREQNDVLSNEYREVLSYAIKLSGYLKTYGELIEDYSNFNASLEKSMSLEEIGKLSDKVGEVTKNLNKWDSYDAINNYVRNNIVYAQDTLFPYISNYKVAQYNGSELVTEFTIEYVEEYIKMPSLTMLIGSGDTIDKAVLDYAMMKNYEINALKNEAKLFLALLTFDDEQESACIIKKEKEYIHIFDPNSVYYQWKITFYTPEDVMSVYENFWSEEGKQIIKIELVMIEVLEKRINYVMEGSIDEIVAYFSK